MPNKKFTPNNNNNNNRLVGPPRGKSLDGQAQIYSTMQIRTLEFLANVNSLNDSDDNNMVIVSNNLLTTRDNNSWMFDNNSSTSTNSQARICTFNYSSSSSSSSSFTSFSSAPTYECSTTSFSSATYSESEFCVNMFIADTSFPLARHVVGPRNTRTLTVLGWTDDIKILNATLYSAHVQNNTPEFITALNNIERLWPGAATILPPKHIHDPDSPGVSDPDNFSTFRPKCTRYNLPGAPGSYVSRFTSHTSHMKLNIRIRRDAAPIDIALLMCAVLLDFMAYISYVISKQYHNDHTMVDVTIIRVRVWKGLSWAANFVDNTIVPDLPLLELIPMQVYVQPRVVRATEYILDQIPESDPEKSDECMPIAAYPFDSDKNAARLDTNPMSPVPREPADTTGKKLQWWTAQSRRFSHSSYRSLEYHQTMEETTEVCMDVSET